MLEQLYQRLSSTDEREREVAIFEARTLPPEGLWQLVLMNERRDYQSMSLSAFPTPLRRFFRYLTSLLTGKLSHIPPPTCYIVAKNLLPVFEKAEDVRLLDAMLRLRQAEGHGFATLFCLTAIKRLLPKYTAEDFSRLSRSQQQELTGFLRMPYLDVEATCCILHALGQHGDVGAIPLLRDMARYGAFDPYSSVRPGTWGMTPLSSPFSRSIGMTPQNKRKVMEAAQEALDRLLAQEEEKRQAQTLLRPSDARSLAISETLLRPASTAPDATPQEELLRPVSPSSTVTPEK